MIAGLIAQHVPARVDGCPGWFGGQIEGRRSIWSAGQKPSEVSGAGPDGEASKAPEAPEASGSGPDGKPCEAGVPLTNSSLFCTGYHRRHCSSYRDATSSSSMFSS
jgi:hypothetical protein